LPVVLGCDIVDLLVVVEDSRRNKKMLKSFNTKNIAIIPKVQNPTSFIDFCPISLCNIVYKIISNVIYLRLQHIIPHIISQDQGEFVLGRETIEGALISQNTSFHQY
jgi:hypothetical protein